MVSKVGRYGDVYSSEDVENDSESSWDDDVADWGDGQTLGIVFSFATTGEWEQLRRTIKSGLPPNARYGWGAPSFLHAAAGNEDSG